MSEGLLLPKLVVPELDTQARLVAISGAMRTGKSSVGITYAWQLVQTGVEVAAFRPEQDERDDLDAIVSQNQEVPDFPATRVQDLGSLCVVEAEVVFLDEPHFWAENTPERLPQPESIKALEQRLAGGGAVIVSMLDHDYMNNDMAWYQAIHRMGSDLEETGEIVQYVEMTGVCELCPRDDPDMPPNPSTSTNLYIERMKQDKGLTTIPEEASTVYVSCCAACSEASKELPEDYVAIRDIS